jgi:signal transduction histidine kinase
MEEERGRPRLRSVAGAGENVPQAGFDECLRDVAHDLRSPLTAVGGFVKLLERDLGSGLDEPARGYFEQLHRGIDRMHSMLERLIELGCIGSSALNATLLAPGDGFRQLAAELKPLLEEKGIALHLPSNPSPLFADPTRFSQVLLNLVTNAIQHMGDVPDSEIRIDVESDPTGATLIVRDNGTGIPEEAHARIFELFRCARAKHARPGSGLGLGIVKRIMDAHGGRIEVESRPGDGARFLAFFPRPQGTSAEPHFTGDSGRGPQAPKERAARRSRG